jgi:hypothetical protein
MRLDKIFEDKKGRNKKKPRKIWSLRKFLCKEEIYLR